MGFVKDNFFGGAEKKAAKAQQKGLERGQEFVREGVEEARQDLFRLFPQAQQSTQQGFQGGLNVLGQALPQQAQAFQGGNVAAQQALISGLPQIQNAILGGQVDLSGITPFQGQLPSFNFAQQQLPFAQGVPQTPPVLGGQQLGNAVQNNNLPRKLFTRTDFGGGF
jgi:hypothetical protein